MLKLNNCTKTHQVYAADQSDLLDITQYIVKVEKSQGNKK